LHADVEAGRILVLMGLSGSGKSTLLRAVNGLNHVARGAVHVDGGAGPVDVVTADKATLRDLRLRHVAMVFQQFGLLPWRTVSENVGLGLELAGLPRQERADRVAAQLGLVGLAIGATRKVGELSGGMQQRVGLARAFATEAPILLMDEPFSALDPLIRARLQDELLDLQKTWEAHDHLCQPRPGRGVQARRSHRDHGRRADRPARHAAADLQSPATDYVADFVAHMNPLNVLRAVELMRAPKTGEKRLPSAYDREVPLKKGMSLSVPADTPLRDLIAIHRVTGEKISVVRDKRCVGIVDADCIYAGLLREHQNP
jgi:glycine betaine/proline transport system ATP-binding protein